MRSKTRIVSAIVLAVALALVASASSLAQSTTKQLSTNFTLVNLGARLLMERSRITSRMGQSGVARISPSLVTAGRQSSVSMTLQESW